MALTLVSHALCPYVQRVAIALAEKAVPSERVTIDLDAKPDWFTAISPLGKVPLLRVPRAEGGEAVLFESSVICEWIEETQPGPLLHPADPLRRAEHRAWMEVGSSILADIYGLETTRDPGVFDAKRASVTAKFARVEAGLGPGPFFAGDRFGLVDAVFAPVFRYFDTFDAIVDLGVFARTPRVDAWRAALRARPSVRQAAGADYDALLRGFLARHRAHLLTLAAQDR